MKAARQTPLTRERIIAAALEVGREQGLDGVSMRRVARHLGVEAMSLYNHVPNKAAIVSGMVDQVLARIPKPAGDLPWDERLRILGAGMYRVFSDDPIVVTIISTGMASPRTADGLRPIEEMLAALHTAGFKTRDARRAANALTALIFGAIHLRPARTADASADQVSEEEWFLQNVDAESMPHLHRMLRVEGASDQAKDFAAQLDLLITGLAATLRPRSARPDAAPHAPARRRTRPGGR